jgi:predicted GNAT family acetyltransferase
MDHILDRPVWTALGSSHSEFCETNGGARRYPPSVIPFASVGRDDLESFTDLARLTGPDDVLFIVQAAHLPQNLPSELTSPFDAAVTQMIADKQMPEIHDPRIERLTEKDAAEMFALADLTKPGPFTRRAQALGDFFGVKENGRLIAMAGVRFRHPGFHEVSGVCTHPDVRGQGLGRLMMEFMCGKIFAEGNQPFLHTFSDNAQAIALYEKLGFRARSPMHVTAFRRAAPGSS